MRWFEGRWIGASDDVTANREGRLSPSQAARMREVSDKVARGGPTALQLSALFVGLFGGPGAAAAVAALVPLTDDAKTALVVGGAVLSIASIAGFFVYLRSDGVRRRALARDPYARALVADVEAGRVVAWDGDVRWTGERYEAAAGGAAIHLTAHAGRVPVHVVAAPPGSYRFYALPASRLVISMESIGSGVDRDGYARALGDAAALSPAPASVAGASKVEGPATVRYDARSAADDDRNYYVPVLEIQGTSIDVSAQMAAAIVPGFPLSAWFLEEKGQRRLVRIEPIAPAS